MDNLDGYVNVATRITQFREKYPEGSLRPLDPEKPYEVLVLDGRTFVVCVAAAYRTADDTAPGVGIAYEPFPGQSPYTEDSELQNAQTGAWGRAIVASLAADTTKSIATEEDVRNRATSKKPDAPVKEDKPKVKRAPPTAPAAVVGSMPRIPEPLTKDSVPEPEPLPEVTDPHPALPVVVEVEEQTSPVGLLTEDEAAQQLQQELLADGSPAVLPNCTGCGAQVETEDQLDLSNLRYHQPLCRKCFTTKKATPR